MSQAIKEKSVYADAFREFSTAAREGEPSWIARVREDAFERFEELGFPTTDEEDWKYTNVGPIARRAFRLTPKETDAASSPDAIAPFVYEEARRSSLVFVNGAFRPELSA